MNERVLLAVGILVTINELMTKIANGHTRR